MINREETDGRSSSVTSRDESSLRKIRRTIRASKTVQSSPKCLLELCSRGNVDKKVGRGVDGKRKMRNHRQAVDHRGWLLPTGRGSAIESNGKL